MRALNSNVNHLFKGLLISMLLMSMSCRKVTIEETVYDNNVFKLDTVRLYTSSSEKTKQKTDFQYISILYADLFGKGISNQELAELSEINMAIGDKTMSNELLISHYLNDNDVILPTNEQMREDVAQFVEDTYVRFYARNPTPYEQHYLKQLIENDPELDPALIYTSFALSNEYYFY